MSNSLSKAEINNQLTHIVEKLEITTEKIKATTALRLDRIAFKLERVLSAQDPNKAVTVAGSAWIALSLLATSIGVALRGVEYYTDEEMTAFEDMADMIIKSFPTE